MPSTTTSKAKLIRGCIDPSSMPSIVLGVIGLGIATFGALIMLFTERISEETKEKIA